MSFLALSYYEMAAVEAKCAARETNASQKRRFEERSADFHRWAQEEEMKNYQEHSHEHPQH